MRIFISWSGERSRALGDALAWFVRNLIQTTEPWLSTAIDKGSRWEPEIAANLEQAGLGIVCLTSDNPDARWLLFEAGALARKFDGKVCTFLLDLRREQVEPPLAQFQHTIAEKNDVWALIETINRAVASANVKPRDAADLREHFEELWPKFDLKVSEIRNAPAGSSGIDLRSERDMLIEMLELVRQAARAETERRDQLIAQNAQLVESLTTAERDLLAARQEQVTTAYMRDRILTLEKNLAQLRNFAAHSDSSTPSTPSKP